MGVPTSEVGYTSAMPRREGHEVHKDMWGNWGRGGIKLSVAITISVTSDKGKKPFSVPKCAGWFWAPPTL